MHGLTADQAELLLRYLKDFQTKFDVNGIDFEADLASMYTVISRCMAVAGLSTRIWSRGRMLLGL